MLEVEGARGVIEALAVMEGDGFQKMGANKEREQALLAAAHATTVLFETIRRTNYNDDIDRANATECTEGPSTRSQIHGTSRSSSTAPLSSQTDSRTARTTRRAQALAQLVKRLDLLTGESPVPDANGTTGPPPVPKDSEASTDLTSPSVTTTTPPSSASKPTAMLLLHGVNGITQISSLKSIFPHG